MKERERKSNKHLSLVSRKERRERMRSRQYLNKIQMNSFPKLLKITNPKTQGQKILNRTCKKKCKPRCITVKLQNTKNKEDLKAARERTDYIQWNNS